MTVNRPNALPEIGGIVHLDHVNFEVPDQDMATMFFVNGLGLTRDPFLRADETNMGINVGMEQFHLPRRAVNGTPPFNGEIGLVVPRLDVIAIRLARLAEAGRFDGTPYSYEPGSRDGEAVVRAPFGFVLRLFEAGTVPSQRPLSIAYVEVAVPPGTSAAIGRFYGSIFATPVNARDIGGCPAVSLHVGPYQTWRFVERETDDYDTHSMHVSFYTINFATIRAELVALGAADGGDQDHLFFFNRLVDPDTRETVFTINNEVRSLYHPDFRRQLANRWPIVEDPFTDQREVEEHIAATLGRVPGA